MRVVPRRFSVVANFDQRSTKSGAARSSSISLAKRSLSLQRTLAARRRAT